MDDKEVTFKDILELKEFLLEEGYTEGQIDNSKFAPLYNCLSIISPSPDEDGTQRYVELSIRNKLIRLINQRLLCHERLISFKEAMDILRHPNKDCGLPVVDELDNKENNTDTFAKEIGVFVKYLREVGKPEEVINRILRVPIERWNDVVIIHPTKNEDTTIGKLFNEIVSNEKEAIPMDDKKDAKETLSYRNRLKFERYMRLSGFKEEVINGILNTPMYQWRDLVIGTETNIPISVCGLFQAAMDYDDPYIDEHFPQGTANSFGQAAFTDNCIPKGVLKASSSTYEALKDRLAKQGKHIAEEVSLMGVVEKEVFKLRDHPRSDHWNQIGIPLYLQKKMANNEELTDDEITLVNELNAIHVRNNPPVGELSDKENPLSDPCIDQMVENARNKSYEALKEMLVKEGRFIAEDVSLMDIVREESSKSHFPLEDNECVESSGMISKSDAARQIRFFNSLDFLNAMADNTEYGTLPRYDSVFKAARWIRANGTPEWTLTNDVFMGVLRDIVNRQVRDEEYLLARVTTSILNTDEVTLPYGAFSTVEEKKELEAILLGKPELKELVTITETVLGYFIIVQPGFSVQDD